MGPAWSVMFCAAVTTLRAAALARVGTFFTAAVALLAVFFIEAMLSFEPRPDDFFADDFFAEDFFVEFTDLERLAEVERFDAVLPRLAEAFFVPPRAIELFFFADFFAMQSPSNWNFIPMYRANR